MAEKGSIYEQKSIALKEKKIKDALCIQQKIYLS